MLDVSLHEVHYRAGDFELHDITVAFPRSTHTAIVGPPASGVSTMLRLIAGELRPDRGEVRIGTRVVNAIRASRRPLLFVTPALPVPGRWSVRHALVNAVRSRTLDRADRFQELALAASKWQLESILDRKLATLSGTQRVQVRLARIELLKPAILVADELLTGAAAGVQAQLADDLYRTLRVLGATVITAPTSTTELGLTDSVVVLEGGTIVQHGNASEVFVSPATAAAATAVGDVNLVPVRINGRSVESVIGAWEVKAPPFQGSGVALVRPDDLVPAAPGEDSDLIFGIEEAAFQNGRWIARGLLTGGLAIRVSLPRDAVIRKGRLIALRYDPRVFTLLPREEATPAVAMNALPSMKDTR